MNTPSELKANILLVDDDVAIRALLSEFLVLADYCVTAVANGEEALTHYRASRPTLMITDIDMPKMNGLELIQQVRTDGDAMPILAISGDASHLIAAENLGAQDSFVKPIDFKLFMQTIDELLS